jgi:conjugative transfer region protein TrbK
MKRSRPCPDDNRRPRRILLTLALGALAAVVAAWSVREPAQAPGDGQSVRPEAALDPMLLRCQRLGDRALADARCRAAWAEHRRRFLQIDVARESRP